MNTNDGSAMGLPRLENQRRTPLCLRGFGRRIVTVATLGCGASCFALFVVVGFVCAQGVKSSSGEASALARSGDEERYAHDRAHSQVLQTVPGRRASDVRDRLRALKQHTQSRTVQRRREQAEMPTQRSVIPDKPAHLKGVIPRAGR